MHVVRRSLHGWARLVGGRGRWAVLAMFVAWLVIFLVVIPMIFGATYHFNEYLIRGQLSPTLPPADRCAFVTLVTGGPYVRGARVLAHTLRLNMKKDFPLVALTVGLSQSQRRALTQVGWQVEEVEAIPFRPPDAPASWNWIPEGALGATHVNALTKMRVWEMTQYDRVVFIDSDIWAVGDVSDLCRRQEDIAAFGPSYIAARFDINSGVMSLKPSKEVFADMMKWWRDFPQKLKVYPAQDPQLRFPDQSLIISYVNNRPRFTVGGLSERYNLNARKEGWSDVRLIHFNVDSTKPWQFEAETIRYYHGLVVKEKDWLSARVWELAGSWIALEEVVNKTYGTTQEDSSKRDRGRAMPFKQDLDILQAHINAEV